MHRLLTSWRGVRGHKNSWCPLLVQTEVTPLSQTCHQHSHLSENQLLASQAGVRTVGGSWRTHTGRSASTLRFTSNCKKSFCRASALADHFIRKPYCCHVGPVFTVSCFINEQGAGNVGHSLHSMISAATCFPFRILENCSI